MKKISILLAPVFCLLLLACHRHPRTTTIVVNNDTVSMRIKYAGTLNFTPDSSAIEGISPYGYIRYQRNDDYLLVNSNPEGQLSFEMTAGGNNLLLDEQGKKFVAKAVQEMLRLGVVKTKW